MGEMEYLKSNFGKNQSIEFLEKDSKPLKG
mgnify:FL=1